MESFLRKLLPESVIESVARLVPQRLLAARRARMRAKQWEGFTPRTIKKHFEDLSFDFHIGDPTGAAWYDVPQVGSDTEMSFVREMIEPGDIIFEAGSHHGYTTLLLSYFTGSEGQVYSWEASRKNYEIALKNIQLNGRSNATLYHAAVGEKGGHIHMSPDFNSKVDPAGEGATVEVERLDDYAQLRPDFLKIDVEGYEVQALLGSQAILASRPKIALEIHTHWLQRYGHTVDDILSLISPDVYDILIQWETEAQPKPYRGERINKRVHLFARPK
jgi:FkbM family methyltransferase